MQAIPLKTWEIDPGKSVSWDKAPGKFNVKVFKPQLVDKLLAAKNDVPYNTNVSIEKDLSISVKEKPSLVFHNGTKGTLKFAVYNHDDNKLLVPSHTWKISKGKSVTWRNAPAKFNLKIFVPGIFDKLVATKKGVADRTTVDVTQKGGSYTVKVK